MKELWAYLASVFLIYLPQNTALMIGMYAFEKQKIEKKKFWICMAISLVAIFILRRLPISYGINTILGMILLILLGTYYLKFPVHKAIKSVFITAIITLIIELITAFIFIFIFSMKIYDNTISEPLLTAMKFGMDKFNALMADQLTNAITGFPASVLLLIVISTFYIKLNKKNKKGVDNGRTGG